MEHDLSQAGFTLLEGMVCTAIMGVLMVGVAGFGMYSSETLASNRFSQIFNTEMAELITAFSNPLSCSVMLTQETASTYQLAYNRLAANPMPLNFKITAPEWQVTESGPTPTPTYLGPNQSVLTLFDPAPVPPPMNTAYIVSLTAGQPLDVFAGITVQPPQPIGASGVQPTATVAFLVPITVTGVKVGYAPMPGNNNMIRTFTIMIGTTGTAAAGGTVVGCY